MEVTKTNFLMEFVRKIIERRNKKIQDKINNSRLIQHHHELKCKFSETKTEE